MAGVTLPLTFQNSFWSQDYRTGLEVLFSQLEKVCVPAKSLGNTVPHLSSSVYREYYRTRRL